MIIKVIDVGTAFSDLLNPKINGVGKLVLAYKYNYTKQSSNEFVFLIQVEYIIEETGAKIKLEILKGQSNFKAIVVDKLSDLHFYQLVRQATHRLSAYVFNSSNFSEDSFRILPDTPSLDKLNPGLSNFVSGFNKEVFGL